MFAKLCVHFHVNMRSYYLLLFRCAVFFFLLLHWVFAQGIPQAQLNLGVCLWQGRGVRRPDPSAAVAWFTRAAAAGLAAAQFNLGVACWRGGWLEAAPIVVDDPKVGEGASSLGDYNRNHRRESGHQRQHRRSNRVEEDLGCLTGDVKSRSSTAKLTASSRVHIMPPNAAVAVGWFEKAAMQGDAQAQYNLAGCYKNGEVSRRKEILGCVLDKGFLSSN